MIGPKPLCHVKGGDSKVRSNGNMHGFCFAVHLLHISVNSLRLHFGFSVAQHAHQHQSHEHEIVCNDMLCESAGLTLAC